jgi:DNA-3-methyladenine glycosylase
MARARCMEITSPRDLPKLTSGPGRLAEAFGITRERDNGKDFTSKKSDLFVADDGSPAPEVLVTKRIGITKAVDQPLRYIVAGSPFVSGPRNLIKLRSKE